MECPAEQPALLLYRVIDDLVDSFLEPRVFDERIDDLEDAIFLSASDEQLREIFQMKRQLVEMRKTRRRSATLLPG
jgi:Mg2+ and Co2+ transporter CorA